MANEIISYLEMCNREGLSLQRGMNFRVGHTHSVILMSVSANAPYNDRFEENGSVLIYEGHDEQRSSQCPLPKTVDQPLLTPSGTLTQNGKFFRAVEEYKNGHRTPERVRVYEKIKQGIWSYNGVFHLIDAWQENVHGRQVFKFKLFAVQGDETVNRTPEISRRRLIPTAVKLEVWKRDKGQCVLCGATDNLHFDHDVPFSKGGSSIKVENVQLMCARHNLQKSDKIL